MELISTRETIGIVEAAGKEPSLRRTRLRLVLDLSIDFFRTKLHVSHGVTGPADDILEIYNQCLERITGKNNTMPRVLIRCTAGCG